MKPALGPQAGHPASVVVVVDVVVLDVQRGRQRRGRDVRTGLGRGDVALRGDGPPRSLKEASRSLQRATGS